MERSYLYVICRQYSCYKLLDSVSTFINKLSLSYMMQLLVFVQSRDNAFYFLGYEILIENPLLNRKISVVMISQ